MNRGGQRAGDHPMGPQMVFQATRASKYIGKKDDGRIRAAEVKAGGTHCD